MHACVPVCVFVNPHTYSISSENTKYINATELTSNRPINNKGEQSTMMLQNHRLSDLVSSYSRGDFAFRDCWSYEMDLIRNNLTDMYAPSRKQSSNPAKILYSFSESPFRLAMASPKI